eukprot:TRINITY_DN2758_c0_g1_i1.p1 TRINITY_DN2758_c0_g1~~TRINITY_DN2758_c0_g1_i1.p1  ORF type:complete len:286 (+),score=112.31 TRINITY_DN2758_c0_g1_i1:387-1244(+)
MDPPPRPPERTLLVRVPPSSSSSGRKEEQIHRSNGSNTSTSTSAEEQQQHQSPEEEEERPDTISLETPRPTPHRTQNLYVETPSSKVVLQIPNSSSSRSIHHHPKSSSIKSEFKQTPPIICRQPGLLIPHKRRRDPPPTRLPALPSSTSSSSSTSSEEEEESIICRDCGKCRCRACGTPKELPRKWVCSGKLLCSPETIVDSLSCYCVLQGAFYHCGKDSEEEGGEEERPLSCESRDCLPRWTALGALSLVLPCLWCYLPLRGCLRLANYVYGRASLTGCTCSQK